MFSNREGHVLESREGRFDFYVCLWSFYFFTSRFLREFFLTRRGVLSLTEDISFSHREYLSLSQRGVLSLTELTDVTDLICAQFRSHRTPPAYRYHRTLLPKIGVGC